METKVTILNDEGLHARPAAALVQQANNFQADINVSFDGKEVSAKSIMALMSLGLTKDAEITITAQGSDADLAISTLSKLVNNKFELNS